MSSFLMQYVDSGENTFVCVSKVCLVVSNGIHRRGISHEPPSVYKWTFLTNEAKVLKGNWVNSGQGGFQLFDGCNQGQGNLLKALRQNQVSFFLGCVLLGDQLQNAQLNVTTPYIICKRTFTCNLTLLRGKVYPMTDLLIQSLGKPSLILCTINLQAFTSINRHKINSTKQRTPISS